MFLKFGTVVQPYFFPWLSRHGICEDVFCCQMSSIKKTYTTVTDCVGSYSSLKNIVYLTFACRLLFISRIGCSYIFFTTSHCVISIDLWIACVSCPSVDKHFAADHAMLKHRDPQTRKSKVAFSEYSRSKHVVSYSKPLKPPTLNRMYSPKYILISRKANSIYLIEKKHCCCRTGKF